MVWFHRSRPLRPKWQNGAGTGVVISKQKQRPFAVSSMKLQCDSFLQPLNIGAFFFDTVSPKAQTKFFNEHARWYYGNSAWLGV